MAITKMPDTAKVTDGQTSRASDINNIIDKVNEIVVGVNAIPAGGGSSSGGAVTSVNGQTGAVVITASSLGALTQHQDISGKADKSDTYTKAQTDGAISTAVSTIQNAVSDAEDAADSANQDASKAAARAEAAEGSAFSAWQAAREAQAQLEGVSSKLDQMASAEGASVNDLIAATTIAAEVERNASDINIVKSNTITDEFEESSATKVSTKQNSYVLQSGAVYTNPSYASLQIWFYDFDTAIRVFGKSSLDSSAATVAACSSLEDTNMVVLSTDKDIDAVFEPNGYKYLAISVSTNGITPSVDRLEYTTVKEKVKELSAKTSLIDGLEFEDAELVYTSLSVFESSYIGGANVINGASFADFFVQCFAIDRKIHVKGVNEVPSAGIIGLSNKSDGTGITSILTSSNGNVTSVDQVIENDVQYKYLYVGQRKSSPLEVTYYGKKIVGMGDSGGQTNPWKDKTIAFYGDSITELCGDGYSVTSASWAGFVASKIGCKAFIRGWGGTTYCSGNAPTDTQNLNYHKFDTDGNKSATGSVTLSKSGMSDTERIEKTFPSSVKNDIDAIILFGGVNDLRQHKAIGDYTLSGGEFDATKVKGAVCSTIKKLQKHMPQAVIIVATPIGGSASAGQDGSAPYKNNNGTDEYTNSRAIKEAAEYMCVPVIDVYATCGINTFVSSWYLKDGLHPYANGNRNNGNIAIARSIIGGLNGILPRWGWTI